MVELYHLDVWRADHLAGPLNERPTKAMAQWLDTANSNGRIPACDPWGRLVCVRIKRACEWRGWVRLASEGESTSNALWFITNDGKAALRRYHAKGKS